MATAASATGFAMPVPHFTASPSQYSLYNAQQISPLNSGLATPNTASPTSPRGNSQLPSQVRQLRPLKSPLYVPAVLRPNDPPKRTIKPSTLTPPQSMHGSLDELDGSTLSLNLTGDSGKWLGMMDEADLNIEGLGKVTGLPTRDHWKPDGISTMCDDTACSRSFNFLTRRHHCRKCGNIFCDIHSTRIVPLDQDANYHPKGHDSRACEHCFDGYRLWHIRRCSRSNSQSSQGVATTPTVSCKGRLGGHVQRLVGATPESLAASVPRDWNWSTF